MRFFQFILSFLVFLSTIPGIAATPSEKVRTAHVQIELVSENQSLGVGEESWIGLRMEMAKDWHIYWLFPGDSGLAPKANWEIPQGWSISDGHWMIPDRIVTLPIVNYGFSGETLLGYKLKVPANEHEGKKTIFTKVTWLVCKEVCITEKAELRLEVQLTQKSGPKNSWSVAFDQLREQQPQRLAGAQVEMDDKHLSLKMPDPFVRQNARTRWDVFPLRAMSIKGELPPDEKLINSHHVLVMDKADPFQSEEKQFTAWLIAETNGKKKSFFVDTTISMVNSISSTGSRLEYEKFELVTITFFAFLGGILLNFMPCVFPVLGIKILSLVKHSKDKPFNHGKAYAIGVIISFWSLSILLLSFRYFGQSLGWGFQLQSPFFVAALILLFTAMAWNLVGLFEIGGRWMGAGASLAGRDGLAGSFFSGILAVVVASPSWARQ